MSFGNCQGSRLRGRGLEVEGRKLRVAGRESKVQGENLSVCMFLIILKNEVFLSVLVG